MANTSLRKASLQSMEAEIESLLKSLESLKDDASDESRKTLKALKTRAIEDDTSVQKIIEELVDSYLKKAAGKKS